MEQSNKGEKTEILTYVEENKIASKNDAAIIYEKKEEGEINRNKPWRIVIRRVVSDGRSDYENIFGSNRNN